MPTYKIALQQDTPYPYVYGVKRGSKPVEVVDLPEDVQGYMSLSRENSECWRCTAFPTLKELIDRVNSMRNDGKEFHVSIGKRVVKGRVTVTLKHTPPPPPVEDLPKLECMATSMDGAHRGLGDWYDKIEEGIKKALRGKGDWTTGWYSSKHEIASARITRVGKEITVEVSVSDDFDTPGLAETTIKATRDIEKVRAAIYPTWDQAIENQKENRLWAMYSIHKDGGWIETYVMPVGMGAELDCPPGDAYHKWGWQGECKMPKKTREKLEDGMQSYKPEVKVGKWTAKMVD